MTLFDHRLIFMEPQQYGFWRLQIPVGSKTLLVMERITFLAKFLIMVYLILQQKLD